MFYAFEYTDGTNTTTGSGFNYCTAGRLVSFKRWSDRESHVLTSTGHAGGGLIKAVYAKDLETGWAKEDAEELFLHEGRYLSELEIDYLQYLEFQGLWGFVPSGCDSPYCEPGCGHEDSELV